MLSYFLFGSPMPQNVKERLTAKAGPRTPARASAVLHMGLGLFMALTLFVPLSGVLGLLGAQWHDYTVLFQSLGRSRNAPVVQGMYALVAQFGPSAGYAFIAAMTVVVGLALGRIGIGFARFKDRMYEELGPVKYAIVMGLFLMMMGVLAKIVLRLLFGVKYLMSFPPVNFNI